MHAHRRTRVLLYVPLLEVGGTEARVGRIARGLDPTRFDCHVAWSDGWGPIGDRLLDAGVSVVEVPLNSPAPRPKAVELLRELAPDIFHSFSYRKDAGDVLAAREAGIPIVLTSRVNTRSWDPHRLVQDWELTRNRQTDRVTAVSKAAAAPCMDIEGVPAATIAIIHNGVSVPADRTPSLELRREVGISDTTTLLGCVANYRAEKGHTLLLEAFRKVVDAQRDAYLVCCGSDREGYKADVAQAVEQLDLSKYVSLLDSRENIGLVYRGVDLYVQTSRTEGLSNAILEAMAHGAAVVATAVGGTVETVLDGITGLLSPLEADGVADAMIALIDDPIRRRAMGRAGVERCRQHFTHSAMLEAYSQVYEELAIYAPAR